MKPTPTELLVSIMIEQNSELQSDIYALEDQIKSITEEQSKEKTEVNSLVKTLMKKFNEVEACLNDIQAGIIRVSRTEKKHSTENGTQTEDMVHPIMKDKESQAYVVEEEKSSTPKPQQSQFRLPPPVPPLPPLFPFPPPAPLSI